MVAWDWLHLDKGSDGVGLSLQYEGFLLRSLRYILLLGAASDIIHEDVSDLENVQRHLGFARKGKKEKEEQENVEKTETEKKKKCKRRRGEWEGWTEKHEKN